MKTFAAVSSSLLVVILCAEFFAYIYLGNIQFGAHTKAGDLGQLGDFFGGLLCPIVSALTVFVAVNVWRSEAMRKLSYDVCGRGHAKRFLVNIPSEGGKA